MALSNIKGARHICVPRSQKRINTFLHILILQRINRIVLLDLLSNGNCYNRNDGELNCKKRAVFTRPFGGLLYYCFVLEMIRKCTRTAKRTEQIMATLTCAVLLVIKKFVVTQVSKMDTTTKTPIDI